MKNPVVAENRRLVGLLEDALARELRLWKVPVFQSHRIQGTAISPFQYQDVILWLGERSRQFKFCPETFALGVCVLNRLLATVKAQPKYLKCIAFTSLILAAKINEEDEVIGSVKDLVEQSGCNFSTAEILRMERIILDKLHWDLYTATAVDFIHIFHALLISSHPHLLAAGTGGGAGGAAQKRPCLQVALWTRQVQHCMACHQLWQFRGSTLALAIITLELETLTPDWFSVFTDFFLSLSFLRGWDKERVSAATFLRLKAFISSSRSRRFSSTFLFSSWCMRFSCSNLSCSSLSFSFSSASVSFTLLTNICLISSSLRCRSPRNSFLLASYVS